MGRIVKLKVEPMVEETFAPFGELMDAKEHPADARLFFPRWFRGRRKHHGERHLAAVRGTAVHL